ncbi:MAG: type II toxin-antitoxin system HicA family toxin [Burkholderiales bacterium]|nr:type II toxin-antitoxin system HicA family toxin [Anaerolineae bacterium]
MNKRKLLKKILSGSKNIRFDELETLVIAFGFHLPHINGSHHMYAHSEIPELLNLQDVKGQTKPYQVAQFIKLIERYDLKLEDEE